MDDWIVGWMDGCVGSLDKYRYINRQISCQFVGTVFLSEVLASKLVSPLIIGCE